jgi:WD40 repeat protein
VRFRARYPRWLGFAPDGKTLAAGPVLWETTTGKELRRVPDDMGFGAYSADFRLMACWGTGFTPLRLWDVAAGKELPLKGDPGHAFAAAFSGDGRRLAGCSYDEDQARPFGYTIRVWDCASGRELTRLKREGDRLSGLALSPDGIRLATLELRNGDPSLHLLDVATGKDLPEYPMKPDGNGFQPNKGMAFSPDGKTLLASDALWEVATGRRLREFDSLSALAWAPDGRTFASGTRLIDPATGAERKLPQVPPSESLSAAFSPDGKLVAVGSSDNLVRLWDVATGKLVNSPEGHLGDVRGIALSSDGRRLLSVGCDGTLRLWDTEAGRELHHTRLVAPSSPGYYFYRARPVALSPDDRILAVGDGKEVTLRDAATGREVFRLTGHSESVESLAFAPDGGMVASASGDRTVRLWDVKTGREVRRLIGNRDEVWAVVFAPDGKTIATGGADHALCLWEAASGRELRLVGWQEAPVKYLAFSPDGKTLAAVNTDGTSRWVPGPCVHLWDPIRGVERGRIEEEASITCLAFSPDGKALAVNRGQGVRRWDPATCRPVGETACGQFRVLAVAFSADGRRLATAGLDGTVLVWDTARLGR